MTPKTPWSHRPQDPAASAPAPTAPVPSEQPTTRPLPRAAAAHAATSHSPPRQERRLTGTTAGIIIGLGLLVLVCSTAFNRHESPPLPSETPSTANARPEDGAHTNRTSTGGLFGRLRITVGRIVATDGATLSVDPIAGEVSIVHTNSATHVMSSGGERVPDLRIGDTVLVKGVRAEDGSFTAQLILGGSLDTLLR
ncbi:DUF5666 domain-containing protein [Nocardia callitridis]